MHILLSRNRILQNATDVSGVVGLDFKFHTVTQTTSKAVSCSDGEGAVHGNGSAEKNPVTWFW